MKTDPLGAERSNAALNQRVDPEQQGRRCRTAAVLRGSAEHAKSNDAMRVSPAMTGKWHN